jgi:hypothetical protein
VDRRSPRTFGACGAEGDEMPTEVYIPVKWYELMLFQLSVSNAGTNVAMSQQILSHNSFSTLLDLTRCIFFGVELTASRISKGNQQVRAGKSPIYCKS